MVRGASVPSPYGGKPRVIMADLDQEALQSRGLTPADVTEALQEQNVILPSGDVKIGSKDYAVAMNNSPDVIAAINDFPVKQINGKTVFVRDVAHVHDGYQVQTNSVSQNGLPGALMLVRKTGGVSTLAVIDGIKEVLPDIRRLIPNDVTLTPIFDQSIFVKAALNSVIMGGLMAAGLTALMILLFLGNWRLTLIILASIPLSIITAMLVLYVAGQTLNTMTLGGFALAVGILVDNATVVIENIERHVGLGEPVEQAIIDGAAEVGVPTFLSTLSICIVFVPVFLLTGTAKYLFSPLSLSVIISLAASLVLSFTLVPVLFKYLMSSPADQLGSGHGAGHRCGLGRSRRSVQRFQRDPSRVRARVPAVSRCSSQHPGLGGRPADGNGRLFRAADRGVVPAVPPARHGLLPAGRCRADAPACSRPAGDAARSDPEIFCRGRGGDPPDRRQRSDRRHPRQHRPALQRHQHRAQRHRDGRPDGRRDSDLPEGKAHADPRARGAICGANCRARFPELQFFFQPADIVNQVLNFGQPAPIDIRVSGPNSDAAYDVAAKLVTICKRVPGIVDAHVFQVPDAPALKVDVDRTLARRGWAGPADAGEQSCWCR